MRKKIQVLTVFHDAQKGVDLTPNQVVDLGEERNKKAVDAGFAKYVETEKAETKPAAKKAEAK